MLARIPRDELDRAARGYGWEPHFVEGARSRPRCTSRWPRRSMTSFAEIKRIQTRSARLTGNRSRGPRWPMIVLRSPKGWTGPKVVDGQKIEGTFRAHQVPMGDMDQARSTCEILEHWMRSYRPEELFDEQRRACGANSPRSRPRGTRRMGANPHANGGLLAARPAPAGLSRLCGRRSRARAPSIAEATRVQGHISARRHAAQRQSATTSASVEPGRDRLQPLGCRCSKSPTRLDGGDLAQRRHVAPDGRVMEVLSASTSARAGSKATC